MLDITSVIILVVVTVASAALCHVIAKKSGRKPVFWGVMGAVFGPFAIPFIFLTKKNNTGARL